MRINLNKISSYCREIVELSAEVNEILNTYPTEDLKHLIKQIIIEEEELFETPPVSSFILLNLSQELNFINCGNADNEEHDDHEKDAITSQLSSVQDLT